MKLRHLAIFRTVCEEEGISKAAVRLSMTQPAVSRSIAELEDELHTLLFDRISRKLYLNETGKLLLSKVIPLLDLYEDLEQSTSDLGKKASLRIGCSTTIANLSFAPIMKEFHHKCNDTEAIVSIESKKEIERKLLHNEIDLALLEGIVIHEALVQIPFSDYPLSVLCSPQHPYAQETHITVEQLVKEALLLRETGSAIRATVDSALLLHNIPVTPAWSSIDSGALLAAAKQGLGITILPTAYAKTALELGTLVQLQVDEFNLRCVNHVVFHKDKFQTVAFQTLINLFLF